ncbi:MAG: MATE family efflux transporter [Clostridium sp.]|nr:MATE family efflux transporter [Clostridium sp.]
MEVNGDFFGTERISKILFKIAHLLCLLNLFKRYITLCFEFIPSQMLSVFSKDQSVIAIGSVVFRIIGISFIPLVTSLIFPVFFQSVGYALKSSMLTIIRTVVLFVPLGYIFSKLGLNYFWLTFPTTEVITSLVGIIFYRQFIKKEVKVDAVKVE